LQERDDIILDYEQALFGRLLTKSEKGKNYKLPKKYLKQFNGNCGLEEDGLFERF